MAELTNPKSIRIGEKKNIKKTKSSEMLYIEGASHSDSFNDYRLICIRCNGLSIVSSLAIYFFQTKLTNCDRINCMTKHVKYE